MDLKETDILGDQIGTHWYYRSKSKALNSFVENCEKSQILDIGAGSGFFSEQLLRNSSAKEAVCVDISYDKEFEKTVFDKQMIFRKAIDSSNADLVLLMDVLEHVDDDTGLLKDYVSKVPTGAMFLISVPAFQWLWSSHDVFLEHKRRYTIDETEKVVKNSGLQIVRSSYYFGSVLPIAAVSRLSEKLFGNSNEEPKSQLKNHHPVTNHFLNFMSDIDLLYLKHNRVAGLTVFCLAQKP